MNSIDIHDATPEQYAKIDASEESYDDFFWKRLTIGNITFTVHKPSEE